MIRESDDDVSDDFVGTSSLESINLVVTKVATPLSRFSCKQKGYGSFASRARSRFVRA
jgi:hypothetical protein